MKSADAAARNYDEIDLDLIEKERAGARARAKRIVREGLPALPANAELRERKKEAAQYRAGISLLWDREQILQETGWSLQKFLAVERYVREEDRRLAEEIDPKIVFAQYRLRQFQAAQELEDLAEVFRHSRQFSALVSAIKTRSDILDRVVKMGQELGVVRRAAREVNVNAQVDFRSMSVRELRVHLSQEVAEVRDLLDAEPTLAAGPAAAVLGRVLTQGEKPDPAQDPETRRKPRVKRLVRPAEASE